MSFVFHKGEIIGLDTLRQARRYIKKRLNPVIVETDVCVGFTSRVNRCCKGTKSMHINERILCDHKQTKELVERYERALT